MTKARQLADLISSGSIETGEITSLDASKLTGTIADARVPASAVTQHANNYVHPNHTGEVTSTADGATVISSTAITGQTEKTSLADADKFLISDSAASGALKYVQKSNLPSGTHTLLETINVSSAVSHIDSSAFISSTYKIYVVYGRMVRPSTNATNLRFRYLEVGGSLMNSANYNYQEVYSLNSGLGRNYHSSADYLQITNTISSSVDNGAFNFRLVLNTDRGTSSDNVLQYYWQGGGATGGDAIYSSGGGWYDAVISNDPPEKIRFYFSSGNIASAKFSIFGITGAI